MHIIYSYSLLSMSVTKAKNQEIWRYHGFCFKLIQQLIKVTHKRTTHLHPQLHLNLTIRTRLSDVPLHKSIQVNYIWIMLNLNAIKN